ncbi:MAG: metal ABC transporter substrate-binding protein [Sulfurimonas sp.]|uniref:metal ABC transporter substrate-binding protein n=1 Tax=Sulfurimonas sp. TaxID=2022749 RepID=UPI002630FA93|nr:metal ABC transporter substrate-binding protein [Sulfurimonas sp.]MDD2651936.1 metal ABC transporter substrate-binding protein [Sulfurimonas sp.]MDD3451938.1 metal ABC transporter substrate-binding protein [Sulfurimonas sp.]
MGLKNLIVVPFLSVFISCFALHAQESQQKPTIAASTFSLYDIAKSIAGESAQTFMILPFGVDAHSYELTPKQMAKIAQSDLVLYNGAGLEPWIKGFSFKKRAVDISTFVKLRELSADHEHHEDVHKGHSHGESGFDPHYWQDPTNMILAAEQIAKELIVLFPKNRALYEKNRDTYITMLQNLDTAYKTGLKECKLDTIIVNHNAFSYLSLRYGFHTEPLSGISPEAQPNAKNMIKLIKFIKEHKAEVIFFEKFANEKAIKSIAKEANVAADVLQPLGNITADEAKAGLGYDAIMRTNLDKISKALQCR